MTEIRKDAKFLRVETLGFNSGNAIVDANGNIGFGIDALQASSTLFNTDTSSAITPRYAICIGYQTGKSMSSTDADGTIAIGHSAGAALTSGKFNTAIGYQALMTEDANGDKNTAIGYQALRTMNIGADGAGNNTAVGYLSGDALTTGTDNTFLGSSTAATATDLSNAVIIGSNAGAAAMTNPANGTVAIGYQACNALTIARFNTAVGYQALMTETSNGYGNTAIGYDSLKLMEIGVAGTGYNTAVGYNSGQALTTGVNNTVVGASAGKNIETTNGNVMIGFDAGFNATNASTVIIGSEAGKGAMTAAADGTVAIGHKACNALTTGQYNTAVGYQALMTEDANGDKNTAIGYHALRTMDIGTNGTGNNTAVGYFSGDVLTTGIDNTFLGSSSAATATDVSNTVIIGSQAGASAMDSDANGTVAIGYNACNALTTGKFNTAIGYQALMTEDTHGQGNTAIGYNSLKLMNVTSTATGYNTAVGYDTCAALTTGTNNTVVGTFAGANLDSTNANVMIGYNAGLNATSAVTVLIGAEAGKAAMTTDANGTIAIGYQACKALTSGQFNTAVGYQALLTEDANGDKNTAIGYQALKDLDVTNNGDGENTALGYLAGHNISTGFQNTCIGSDTATTLTTGTGNTLLGYACNVDAAGAQSRIVLGHSVSGDANNRITIGNSVAHVYNDFNSAATWTYSSDQRQKKNIANDPLGLEFIKRLRTVTYQHKSPSEFPQEWTSYDPTNTSPMGGNKTIHGLIAQEVKKALHATGNTTFGGWDVGSDGRQYISLTQFILPLVKAVQELSTQVTQLQQKVAELSP